MPELYSGPMPLCVPCLDERHDDCLDLDMPESDVFGPYACGCEEH